MAGYNNTDINNLTDAAGSSERYGGRNRQLVADDTDALLGIRKRKFSTDVFGKLNDKEYAGDDAERNLQYPLDLGSLDSTHFILFKIYNGHSSKYETIMRTVQELEVTQALIDDLSAEGTQAERAKYVEILQNTTLSDGGKFRIQGTVSSGNNPFSGSGGGILIWNPNEQGEFEEANVRGTDIGKEIERLRDLASKAEAEYVVGRSENQNQNAIQSGFVRESLRKAEIRQKETIALYLPHKLNVAGFNTYDTPDFEIIQSAEKLLQGEFSGLFGVIRRKAAGIADDMGSIVGAEINAERTIAAKTSRVINPRRETLFQSPEMRKFEFAFEFAPRNLDESKAIREIVQTFKHHAYPQRGFGGFFLKMPAEFQLEFYSIIDGTAHENLWLNKIARCVLQEINVDFTAAGSVSMFHNAAPTHINLTLSFQEVELITQEYVDAGY